MKGISESPYMQYAVPCVRPDLYKGIVHVDGTSRIQTVTKTQHPGLHTLLMQWYQQTGCPMLINTSLNVKNQPLVNDLTDARCFESLYNIPVFS
jgi:carbamoyltransferase